jgi:hypothetical protein
MTNQRVGFKGREGWATNPWRGLRAEAPAPRPATLSGPTDPEARVGPTTPAAPRPSPIPAPQVCDIVTESPDPQVACRRVLDAALFEWEERMSADNISVVIVEFDWSHVIADGESAAAAARAALQPPPGWAAGPTPAPYQPVRAPRPAARVGRQQSARRLSMEQPGEYALPCIREGPT